MRFGPRIQAEKRMMITTAIMNHLFMLFLLTRDILPHLTFVSSLLAENYEREKQMLLNLFKFT